MRFEWDSRKAKANLRKHGISFDEAKTVFDDQHMKLMLDVEHSDDEDRFLAIGFSRRSRLLLVCHCYRYGDVIRIFSAHKASQAEMQLY